MPFLPHHVSQHKTVSRVICTDLLFLNNKLSIVKLKGDSVDFKPASPQQMMKFLANKFGSQTGIAPVLEYQKFIMTTFTNDSTL